VNLDAGDLNSSGGIDKSDLTYYVDYMFGGEAGAVVAHIQHLLGEISAKREAHEVGAEGGTRTRKNFL
jgi:hypothetical protein